MKLLLIDLETSPHVGLSWGVYEQNIIKLLSYSQILCISWKWHGEKTTYALGQCDMKGYKPGKLDDKELVSALWNLLDKADAVLAHNGDSFDVKVANSRFMFHGLTPPSPYLQIDTKKMAKRIGRFPTNKLNDLGMYFGEGQKVETGGFSLWERCMEGDAAAWAKMKKYNKQDVVLLERVYNHLRPWVTGPNENVFMNTKMNCTKCGSHETQQRGFRVTATGKRKSYQCQSCGGWSQGPLIKADVVLR